MAEHAAEPLDDRQAEAEAARRLGALIETLEFLEYDSLLGERYAHAGVPNLDAQRLPRSAGIRPAPRPSAYI